MMWVWLGEDPIHHNSVYPAEVWIGALIQIIGAQTSYFETSYQGLCMAGTRSNANALSKLHGMLLTASAVEADGLSAAEPTTLSRLTT